MDSPIFTIPGIGRHMGAMILAEVGDFSNFASADKLLAYAGLSPSTYQSGQLQNCYAHMEKRGSRYLRYALFNAAKYVCLWCPTFSAYLEKKGRPWGQGGGSPRMRRRPIARRGWREGRNRLPSWQRAAVLCTCAPAGSQCRAPYR